MQRGLWLALAVASTLMLAAPASAQVVLADDWEATFAEAKERNIPVLFMLGREGKAPWVRWFSVPMIASYLNDRCLVIIAHRGGGHEAETVKDPKTKEEKLICPIYKQWDCGVHKGFYDDYAGNFDYKELPAGFILRPDGSEAASNCQGMAPKVLVAKLKEVQFALGEGVYKSEITKLEKQLSKGDAKAEQNKFKAALKVYEKALKKKKGLKPHLKGIVEDRLAKLDKAALEAIEKARDLEPKKRHDELKRIARELKGREPSKVAKEVLSEVEGS